MAAGEVAAVTKKKKLTDPGPLGLNILTEGIEVLGKTLGVLVILCIVLALTAVGFAAAWWVK